MMNEILVGIKQSRYEAAKDGVLLDQQGRDVLTGNRIMYLTFRCGSIVQNYGVVQSIKRNYGDSHSPWSIEVLKQIDTHYCPKVMTVRLTDPVLFVCGHELEYPV
jgi:hypothetical protein